MSSHVLEQAAVTVARNRTTVSVAHRLSQAARGDRILVMERGIVIEDGHHDELLERDRHYAHLWRASAQDRSSIAGS